MKYLILLISLILLSSCDQFTKDIEQFKSLDDSLTVRLLAKGESEIIIGNNIHAAKYTLEEGKIRVVVTISGTMKILYFKRIEQGLWMEAEKPNGYNKGDVLFSSAYYDAVKKDIEKNKN